MRLIHVGDLHIGKRIHECSMLENQRDILDKILSIVEAEKPDGVLLAGDIYDKSIPSAEAVQLWDYFLTGLVQLETQVFVISGNHDSPERLHFGSDLLHKRNIHIAGIFQGRLQRQYLTDQWGETVVYLMPYVKPAMVRPYFPETEVVTYQDAIREILSKESIDTSKRNVIVAHQFVTGHSAEPQRCDSEQDMVGGLDPIDVSIFAPFDYVALGHLHGPQRLSRDTVRYGGSILKYSFSEINHKKSVTVIEMEEKGMVFVRQIPLIPKNDMRQIKGPIEKLLDPEVVRLGNPEDFLQVTLTDEEPVADPLGRLRTVYPNVMVVSIENSRTKSKRYEGFRQLQLQKQKSTLELFEEFFLAQNGGELEAEQKAALRRLIEQGEEQIL